MAICRTPSPSSPCPNHPFYNCFISLLYLTITDNMHHHPPLSFNYPFFTLNDLFEITELVPGAYFWASKENSRHVFRYFLYWSRVIYRKLLFYYVNWVLPFNSTFICLPIYYINGTFLRNDTGKPSPGISLVPVY